VYYLSIQMVGQDSQEFGLDRERLVQEALVEGLFNVVDKEHCHSLVVILWSTSATNHLQNICDWHVHVSLFLAVKNLSSFDNHQMRGEVDSPR
jgi:hypothetical protein